METYKRKRLSTLQEEIDTINDGSHTLLRKKTLTADRDRTDKLARAARRRDCTLEVAGLGTQKEMDDIRDWWKIEAKRVKDELYAKICDSVGAPPRYTDARINRCALAPPEPRASRPLSLA